MHLKVTQDYGLVPVPSEADSVKYVYNRKVGDVLSCDVKICRNYKNLQRFMVFINVTFDMQEFFDSKEAYRYWLTMKAGWFDTIVFPSGKTMFKAKSINFDSMDEPEFEKLFSTAIDVFIREIGKDLTEDDILQAISFD